MDENNPQKSQAQSSLGSDTNSEESVNIETYNASQTICLVGAAAHSPPTVTAAKAFGATVLTSETGLERLSDPATIFCLSQFEGQPFEALYKARRILLGPPALQQLAARNEALPSNTRPLYSVAMGGVVVCVTGFRDKAALAQLVTIVHQLGGSIRKDISHKVTHLIAHCPGGAKYEYADTFRLPVMRMSWVLAAWDNREDIDFVANNELFVAEHRLKPFHGARVCFLGFPEEEEKDMINVLEANGGLITTIDDSSCTHVVADDGNVATSAMADRSDSILRAHIVKAEWFWTSVQKETCLPEKNYLFEGHIEGVLSPNAPNTPAPTPTTSTTHNSNNTPSSASRRKRKRLNETLFTLASATHPHLLPTSHHLKVTSPLYHLQHLQNGNKQRRSSSASDAGLLSVSGSFLDCTASPESVGGVGGGAGGKGGEVGEGEGKEVDSRKVCTARQQVFQELVHTESNYVNILHTIVTTFKKHLEDMPEPDQLLNNTELKIIFGRIPLIYTTHLRMLDSLRATLNSYADQSTLIGDVVLRYSTDLLHAYPPFVNAYEDMKEMLQQCDRTKPRFHAFLKACQTRPECGRQGLMELMIRPVQRLGSISLLLNDILKHTAKTHADHSLLVQALASIKEVLTHINEDKRKAEGQRVMFDIFNEIDNCPPDVVSSHRTFVAHCDVVQLSSSDGLSTSKGTPLALFLFSDQLEICKRRGGCTNRGFNSLKSPNGVMVSNGGGGGNGGGVINHKMAANGAAGAGVGVKPYKHVRLMSLSAVRRVIDIKDTEDCQRVCSLIFMNNDELKEKLFSFAITDEDVDKTSFLKILCHQMATNACTADSEKFMAYCEPHQLDIDTSYLHGTLSKAFKFANRTRLKVGRAFSFNKTPSKLKRAVSSMMSPFGSSTNLTPSSQLAQMRLASYSNISELGHAANTDGAPIAPLSVQPTRKLKTSSLGVNALKRL